MAKEAESFFENNADPAYWAGLTDEYKDGLVISYINFGQTTMNEKYAEALKKGPYRPELGEGDAGGESYFYYNVEAVRQALATPGPGAGVPLPLELAPGTPPVGGVVASQPEFQRGLTEATNAWWENPAPLTGQLLAAVTGGIKADLGLITSDVEDIQGFSELSRAIQKAVAGDVAGAATLELSDRTVWYLHADDAQGISVIGGDGTDDLMLGGTLADNLSGGDGADVLIGGAGADTLEGGAGDDILVGGLGDNQLRGGVGFDRYIVGRGQDTITDADGEGVIDTSAGRRIAGPFVKGSDGSYMSLADASVQASKSGDTLMITIAGGAQVVIENFTSGDLGIWLTDNAPTAPQPTLTILGDLTPVEPEQYDILGNLVVDPNSPAPDRADVLNGRDNQSEGDLIQSKGGDDVVAAKKGDDKVEAGTGSDIVNAGEGNDLVLGGADLDLLWGMAGNDRLYADRRLGCEPPRRQARQGNRLPVPPMETGERLHGEFRFSLALANRPVLALASRVPSASAGCPRRLIVSDQGHRTGGGAVIMRAAHRHPGIGPHHTTTPPLPRPDTRRGSSALSGGGHVAPGHLLCRSRTVPIGALPARIAR
jgi:Ca2+-binding RTX toxin-like protein